MWKLKLTKDNNPFFSNLGKKTLAVVIAITLWIVANLEFDIERNIEIPMNYTNLSEKLIVVNDIPRHLNLRLRGPRSQLSAFADSNVNFTFDLANIQEGISTLDIKSDQLSVPEDVQVVTISPGEFDVQIDKIAAKTVNVNPVVEKPGEGFEIRGDPVVSPPKVNIRGPEDLILGIDSVNTSNISLKGEKSRFTIQVPLQLPSPLVEVENNELVRVTVNLDAIILEKEFRNMEIKLNNFNNIDYKTDSKLEADLLFGGPYNLINNLKSEDIDVFLDGRDLDIGNNKSVDLEVKVDYPYPDSINLKNISPNTVNIKLN